MTQFKQSACLLIGSKIFQILIFLLCLSPVACFSESLSVAGINVKIGMKKSKIYSEFQDYRIDCLPGKYILAPECDSWLIKRRNTPHHLLANFGFNNGKVSTVYKYFDTGLRTPESIRFYEIFHSILSDLTNNGTKKITIQTKTESKKGMPTQKAIFFIDGNRVVKLDYLGAFESNQRVFFSPKVSIYDTLR